MPCCWINFWAHRNCHEKNLANKWRPVKAVGPKALVFFQVAKKAMVSNIQMDPNRGILGCKWNLSKWMPNLVKGRAADLLRAALHLLHHHLPVFQILETGVRTPRVSDLFNFSQIFKIIYTHDFSPPNISIEVPPFWANFEIRTSFFTIIKGLWYVTSRFSMSLFGMRYHWASRCCRCLHSVALHLGHLPRWHEQLLYSICPAVPPKKIIDENNSNTICLWVSMIYVYKYIHLKMHSANIYIYTIIYVYMLYST